MEFPQAWAGKLPENLAGDEILVRQVRSEVSEAGVKIILEMFPEQPYIWKREMTPLSGGRAMMRLTVWADPEGASAKPPTAALPATPPPLAPRASEAAAPAPEPAPGPGPGEQAGEEPLRQHRYPRRRPPRRLPAAPLPNYTVSCPRPGACGTISGARAGVWPRPGIMTVRAPGPAGAFT
jgi:hypothetical protein